MCKDGSPTKLEQETLFNYIQKMLIIITEKYCNLEMRQDIS